MLKNTSSEAKETNRPASLRQPHEPDLNNTRPMRRDPETLLVQAETADTLEETLLYLKRVLAVNPQHRLAARKLEEILGQILARDAFLGYVNEDDSAYRVQTGANLLLPVAKERAVPEPFPPKRPSPLQPAFRWLGIALLGLPLAGLGTLVSIPLILIYVVLAYRRPLSRADQIRASLMLVIAIVLTGLALILALLLLLHM